MRDEFRWATSSDPDHATCTATKVSHCAQRRSSLEEHCAATWKDRLVNAPLALMDRIMTVDRGRTKPLLSL